jgi:DnaK suppressor protein
LEPRQRDQLRLALELRRKTLLDQLRRETAARMREPQELRELQELRDIEAAFRRLDDDKYGICAACGGAIAFEQLQAAPQAARCLECQQRYEQALKPFKAAGK